VVPLSRNGLHAVKRDGCRQPVGPDRGPGVQKFLIDIAHGRRAPPADEKKSSFAEELAPMPLSRIV
jgi:hypothetical protein